MSEGDAPCGRHRIPHRRALRAKEEGLSCCVAPSHHPARPDHPTAKSGPPKTSVRRPVSRSRRAGTVHTRHRQAIPVQAKCPCARCRFANALPPVRRMPRRLSGTCGRCRNWPAAQGAGDRWPQTTGAQGRPSAGHGAWRAPTGLRKSAAFRQTAPAARPASSAPRPHCECPGWHRAAWRSSPPHCGWSPPCHAACRRRRTEIRSQ